MEMNGALVPVPCWGAPPQAQAALDCASMTAYMYNGVLYDNNASALHAGCADEVVHVTHQSPHALVGLVIGVKGASSEWLCARACRCMLHAR